MSKAISVRLSDDSHMAVRVDRIPSECPVCHMGIKPLIRDGFLDGQVAHVAYQCPREECKRIFIGRYFVETKFFSGKLDSLYPKTIISPNHSDEIMKVSSTFCEIYDQAYAAEQYSLVQVCGVGYRKAIEFLVKDYVISQISDSEKQDEIRKKWLGRVIEDDIKSENVRTTAKLATWLGNDETHYVRLWEEMDLQNLKELIAITVGWIETEEKTRAYKNRMG